jgi:excisionase family DNA binding protein
MLTVDQAAQYLKVSSKTLRRWESKGLIVPIRTSGGHRRYTVEQLKEFKSKSKRKNINQILSGALTKDFELQAAKPSTLPSNFIEIKNNEHFENEKPEPLLKHLPKRNKFFASSALVTIVAILVLFSLIRFGNSYFANSIAGGKLGNFASNSFKKQEEDKFQVLKSLLYEDALTDSGVLAATSFTNVKFAVNVESIFNQDASFFQNVNIGGFATVANDLAVNSGNITTTSQTVNLFDENALSFNIGGQSDLITLGSPDGSITANNNVLVSNDLDIVGNLSVDGTAFLNTLAIGGSSFIDLVGEGLQVVNQRLTTSLGDIIKSEDIEDGSILAIDLNISNTGTNGQLLSYDVSTGGFTWISQAGSNSKWTETGSVTYLSNSASLLTVGATEGLAKIAAVGTGDNVQLLARAFSGQTNNIFAVQGSTGNNLFAIGPSGNLTQSGAGQVTFSGNVDATAGLDVTGSSLTVGGSNATITTAGVITGTQLNIDSIRLDNNEVFSSGNLILNATDDIVLNGYDCTVFASGGKLTTDANGVVICAADESGSAITSPFEDLGAGVITLVTSTNNVSIGTTNNLGRLAVVGRADETQLLVRGNATQTSNLVVFEQSDGTDIFALNNSGDLTLAGNAIIAGTTGITLSGTGADLLFTGTGDHLISASSGTLQLGSATLTGTITGNNQNLGGVGVLDFGDSNVRITGVNIGLTTDVDLLALANNALTVNGNVTVGTLATGTVNDVVIQSSGTLQTRTIDSRVWDGSFASNFLQLTDTPGNYTDQAGMLVRVVAGENGLEFVDPATVGINYWNRLAGVLSPITEGDAIAATSAATTVATFTSTGTVDALRAGGVSTYLTIDNAGNLSTSGTTGITLTGAGADLFIGGTSLSYNEATASGASLLVCLMTA